MTFGAGLDAFNAGLTLIRQPRIRSFVWAPALVSLLVIGLSLAATFAQIDAAVTWLLQWLPDWLNVLGHVLRPLAYLLCVLLATWIFGYVATIIASPFLGVLAGRVEGELTGTHGAFEQGVVGAAVSAIGRELRKLLYYLPRALGLLLLTLVPLVNVAAPVLWLLFGAWMVAVQYADYVSENHGRSFRHTLATLRANRAAAVGFGAPTFAILSVPLLNFIAVPIAVVGGTALKVRLSAAADTPEPD